MNGCADIQGGACDHFTKKILQAWSVENLDVHPSRASGQDATEGLSPLHKLAIPGSVIQQFVEIEKNGELAAAVTSPASMFPPEEKDSSGKHSS